MLAFLLPARIVSKNYYYYFANNSHLRIYHFFWLHSNGIVLVKKWVLYVQIIGINTMYKR